MDALNRNIEAAEKIARMAARKGGQVFFVGGCVRDELMGLPRKDIDIEVHGIAPETLEDILNTFGGLRRVGTSFGVYGISGYDMDIAMPRRDENTGSGHRDFRVYVDPYLGIENAARRRDFTVNAIMKDVLTGQIMDPFGGQNDLKNGILRHTDDSTFGDDPLRVLRGAQFCARFGFSPAPETAELMKAMDLTALAGERIFGELEKALMKADRPSIFFNVLRDVEQLDVWFPETKALMGVEQNPEFHPEGDVWNHTMLVVDEAAKLRTETGDPMGFMLAALTHDFGKAVTTSVTEDGRIHALGHEIEGLPLAEQFLDRIITGRKQKEYVLNLVELHMKPNIIAAQRVKVKSTNKLFDRAIDPKGLILLAHADQMGKMGVQYSAEDEKFLWERLDLYEEMMARPFVSGEDLIAAGIKPGPDFSEILDYAHKLRLAGTDKENAMKQTLAYVRQLRKKSPDRG